MKIKKEVYLREIAGEYLLVPIGKTVDEFNGVFALTPVGAAIFQAVENGKNEDEILAALLEEFDVDEDTAEKDMNVFLEKLKKFGIIE